ncbi:MAG: DUF488 family protein [Candidatus Jordarchaeales archaeon]
MGYASDLTVWTIGTSTRSADEFISLLKGLGVEVAVDVRRFPTSRFEWFKKEELKRILNEAGIDYVHFEGLGGYRRGGYEKYMGTREFEESFRELLRLVESGRRVAIFCSERLFFKCHRRFIADELARRGITVIHVVDEKRMFVHKSTAGDQRVGGQVGGAVDTGGLGGSRHS